MFTKIIFFIYIYIILHIKQMGVATKQKEHLLDRYFKQLVFNGTPPVYIYKNTQEIKKKSADYISNFYIVDIYIFLYKCDFKECWLKNYTAPFVSLKSDL